MKKNTLTCAHAIVKYLIAQKILINGKRILLTGVNWFFWTWKCGVFRSSTRRKSKRIPTYRGNEQKWLLQELVMQELFCWEMLETSHVGPSHEKC